MFTVPQCFLCFVVSQFGANFSRYLVPLLITFKIEVVSDNIWVWVNSSVFSVHEICFYPVLNELLLNHLVACCRLLTVSLLFL